MNSGGACEADNGVAMDADEAPGLANTVALGRVVEDARRRSVRGGDNRYSGVPLRSEKRARQALQ